MKWPSLSFIRRNLLGLLAVLLAHDIINQFFLNRRLDLTTYSPYLFLLLMYGWIVFHNRVLFDRLFLRDNRVGYFGWLVVFIGIGTINMYLILKRMFGVSYTLPFILRYYSDTVTGFGVYITYRFLTTKQPDIPVSAVTSVAVNQPETANNLIYLRDGIQQVVDVSEITYVEGLENYIKVITPTQTHIVRMTLKEAELRLPQPQFVRISKSHIVNIAKTERLGPDDVKVGTRTLRIGRVFKRFATEKLLTHR